MELNPSPTVRKYTYILVTLGTALIVPLDVANAIPELVTAIWSSLSAAACVLAAVNVTPSNKV